MLDRLFCTAPIPPSLHKVYGLSKTGDHIFLSCAFASRIECVLVRLFSVMHKGGPDRIPEMAVACR